MAHKLSDTLTEHISSVSDTDAPSTPNTTPHEISREPSDQFEPYISLLPDSDKIAQFSGLQALIDSAQNHEILSNQNRIQEALDGIWNHLNPNDNPKNLPLFSQIREHILRKRSLLLLSKLAIRSVKRAKPVPAPKAAVAALPTQATLVQPQSKNLNEYYLLHRVRESKEKKFRDTFKTIIENRFTNRLNTEQTDLLLASTQNENIQDKARRNLLLTGLKEHFPEQYSLLETEINQKAERLEEDNKSFATNAPAQAKPKLPPDPLRTLKASRRLPYEILAPYEADFMNKPSLRAALEGVTAKSVETLSEASENLKEALRAWFALSKVDKAVKRREIRQTQGEAAREKRPIFPKEIRAAYAQTNSGLTKDEMTRMSQAIAFERAGIRPTNTKNSGRARGTAYRDPLSLDQTRLGGYQNIALPHAMSVHDDEVVTSSGAVLGQGTSKTVTRGFRLKFESPREPVAQEVAISHSNTGMLSDILGDTETIKKYLNADDISKLGLVGILEHQQRDYEQGRLAATELMQGDFAQLSPKMTLA
jgi:hypothetical protein